MIHSKKYTDAARGQPKTVTSFAGRNISVNKDLTKLELGEMHFALMIARRYDQMNYWRDKQAKLPLRDRYLICRHDIWPKIKEFNQIEFGDPDFSWTPADAFELADEWNRDA